MRTILSMAIAGGMAACAAAPPPVTQPGGPVSGVYDVNATTMVSIVYDATRASNYRVAVVEPKHDQARFVMMPREGGAPLVVHLAAYGARSDRFENCIGACATQIAVLSLAGENGRAQELLDAIAVRARAARLDQ